MAKKKAWIAFGGNMGDSVEYIESALKKMEERGMKIIAKSSLIRTAPYGGVEQDDFINGACIIETEEEAQSLMQTLLQIEKELGRVRIIRWGPRTIDLDMIFYEDEVMNTKDLILPHPEMQKRSFVLEPIAEISPDKVHPVFKKSIDELLKELKTKEELEEHLAWLDSREKFGIKLGLENTELLLKEFDNPHEKIKCLHVAGTNGKGSVSTYLSSVLQEAGYKVGLFTSPFIETFRERFQINNENLSEAEMLELFKNTKHIVEDLEKRDIYATYFEIITAMCFACFEKNRVDFAVMEVGLGGLYDATNVIKKPLASFITTIDYDHTEFLGNTLAEIAEQKGGIIKNNCLVFCGDSFKNEEDKNEVISVLQNIADSKNAEFTVLDRNKIEIVNNKIDGVNFNYASPYGDLKNIQLSMWGEHQALNCALTILALQNLKEKNQLTFTEEQLYKGLKKAKIIARLEVLGRNPRFIIDGAHNLQGASALAEAMKSLKAESPNDGEGQNKAKIILGIGILKDKDYKGVIKLLAPLADEIVATQIDMPRALPASELKAEIEKINSNIIEETDVQNAFVKTMSLAKQDSVILWAGSLYLMGIIRPMYFTYK